METALNTTALLNKGIQEHQRGNLRQAEEIYKTVLSAYPNQPDALHLLGVIAHQRGDFATAEQMIQRAITIKPNKFEYYNNIGNVYSEMGKRDEALHCFRRCIELNPKHGEAYYNIGIALAAQGNLAQAMEAYQQAIAADPNHHKSYNNLGNLLKDYGKNAEAIKCHQQAIQIKADYTKAHSNLLLMMHYLPGYTLDDFRAEHQRWNMRHGLPLTEQSKAHAERFESGKKLRVGFVSADFRQHPVGYFLTPVLKLYDKQQFEFFAYSDCEQEDGLTANFRSYIDHWRVSLRLSDENLCRIIEQDKIDILIDLAGHTAKNRMRVFAMKPAPVQVSWLGYPDTTGLTAMDYYLADHHTVPNDTRQWFSETVYRLPGCYLCYAPPYHAPPVSELPALKHRFITLGCFNNIAKINHNMLDIWAKILESVPQARLILKDKSFSHSVIQQRYAEYFQQKGIQPGRVEILGVSPNHTEHLKHYHRIDIALDCYPYNGTTTTCEALYMGVPVISLAGDSFVSRQGLTILSAVGLNHWTAASNTEYINAAVQFAGDIPMLAECRSSLRERLLQSCLCNSKQFVKKFEDCLLDLWKQQQNQPVSQNLGAKTQAAEKTTANTAQVRYSVREKQLLGQAAGLFQAGAYRKTEELCLSILQEFPRNIGALDLLGALCLKENRTDEAEKYYRTAYSVNSLIPEINNNLGSVLLQQNRLAEAIEFLDQAISQRPLFPQAHNNMEAALQRYGKNEQRFKVSIVTASIGTDTLVEAIKSVQAQTYPQIEHLIVADGQEYLAKVQSMIPAVIRHPIHVLTLPYNTGANGYHGHRIYGAAIFLVNGRYICWLDEDNWFDPDHVSSLMETIESQGLQWAYSLRKIYNKDRILVTEDNCESLGRWPTWNNETVHLVDVNCYMLRLDVAIKTNRLWYHRWTPDFNLCRELLANYPKFDLTKRHTVNYMAGNTENSVSVDFFLTGNAVIKQRYPNGFPWIN